MQQSPPLWGALPRIPVPGHPPVRLIRGESGRAYEFQSLADSPALHILMISQPGWRTVRSSDPRVLWRMHHTDGAILIAFARCVVLQGKNTAWTQGLLDNLCDPPTFTAPDGAEQLELFGEGEVN